MKGGRQPGHAELSLKSSGVSFVLVVQKIILKKAKAELNSVYNEVVARRYNQSGRRVALVRVPTKQAHAVSFQAVGIGVNLYGNLNLKQCTAGIQLGVALGRISTRPKR